MRERPDEGIGARDHRGLIDVGLDDLRITERQVIEYGAREQLNDLRHDTEHSTALPVVERSRILLSHHDAAAPRAVESSRQLQHGALACASASYQSDMLTWGNVNRHTMQHRLSLNVSEVHALEGQRLRGAILAGLAALRAMCLVRSEGERLEDSLRPGHGALHRLPLLAERRDRLEEPLQQQQERRQGAERDPRRHEPRSRADREQGGHRRGAQDCRRGRIERRVEGRPVRGGEPPAQDLAKAAHELRFAPKRADHLDAPEILLQTGIDGSHRHAGVAFCPPDPPLYHSRRDHERDSDGGGYGAQRGAQRHHRSGNGDESHEVGYQHGDAGRKDGVESIHVGGTPADHVADRHAVEIARGQALHVGEQASPQLAEQPLCCGRRDVSVEKGQTLHRGYRQQVEERQPTEAARITDGEMPIDDVAEHQRWNQLHRCGGQDQDAHQDQRSAPLGQKRTEAPQHLRASQLYRGSGAGCRAHRWAISVAGASATRWARQIRAYKPSADTSSSCDPLSATLPRSRTTTWSACGNPARRCEQRTMVARCSGGASGPNASRSEPMMAASVVTSTAEKGSSSTSNPGACGAAVAIARARPMRWRCPPETRRPPSPICVSSPWPKSDTSSSSAATRMARRSAASSRPPPAGSNATFCPSEPEKSTASCGR